MNREIVRIRHEHEKGFMKLAIMQGLPGTGESSAWPEIWLAGI